MNGTRQCVGTYTPEQLADTKVIESLARIDGDVMIPLKDGTIRLPCNLAIFNGYLWEVYLTFKIQPDLDHVFFPERIVDKQSGKIMYSVTADVIFDHLNNIYNELILKYKIEPYMAAVAAVFRCIQRFTVFADIYTREYQVSLDIIKMAKLMVQKPVKEIVSRKLDETHGTKFAEKQFEKMTNDLMSILANPTALEYNPLLPFMMTKLLKRNQVPQMFGAYGTRSDITDEMKKHAISESAFSGLLSVEDYATESLSAKKATFFNSSVISTAQYFARRCRLGASKISTLYKGSCGSTVTLPFTIKSRYKKNFIGKFVKVDDQTRHLLKERKWPQYPDDDSIELTKSNIDLFVDREIQMWSPFGCRYTDGVCEHCAGCMHQKLHAYIPEDIWLGVFMSTLVVSSVTQKILSAKHLIKTSSKEFLLNAHTAKFLDKQSDALLFTKEAAKRIKTGKVYLRLSQDSFLGPLGDLTRKVLPAGIAFSRIENFSFVDENGHPFEFIEVSDGTTFPYLSAYAMYYCGTVYKRIRVDRDSVDIPMDNFDFSKAFLRYTAVNDDMVSFVTRVDNFVMRDIRDYTNIADCLDRFSSLIYDKTDVHIFPIEVMLRGYLASGDSYETPVITDPRAPVRFVGLGEVISNAALSTKLAFQGINAFFEDPRPTLKGIGTGKGFYDPMFSFASLS